MNVTIIVGLPGSGKTHRIEEIKKDGDIILDDFTSPELVDEAMKSNPSGLILSDPFFCDHSILEKVLRRVLDYTHGVKIEYFENDPQKALHNAAERENKQVNGLIKQLSRIYNPPPGAIKIYQKQN